MSEDQQYLIYFKLNNPLYPFLSFTTKPRSLKPPLYIKGNASEKMHPLFSLACSCRIGHSAAYVEGNSGSSILVSGVRASRFEIGFSVAVWSLWFDKELTETLMVTSILGVLVFVLFSVLSHLILALSCSCDRSFRILILSVHNRKYTPSVVFVL